MQSNNFKNNKKGFTLIELLIVIAIIAIIVAVVFIALDPLTRFRDSRNAQRWQDIASIADSIRLYQVDNNGQVPTGLDENWRMLGTDITGCSADCGSTSSSEIDYSDSTQSLSYYSNNTYSVRHWFDASGISSFFSVTASAVLDCNGSCTGNVRVRIGNVSSYTDYDLVDSSSVRTDGNTSDYSWYSNNFSIDKSTLGDYFFVQLLIYTGSGDIRFMMDEVGPTGPDPEFRSGSNGDGSQTGWNNDNGDYFIKISITQGTQEACLDLSSELSNYLNRIPEDPQNGDTNKTYYTIRKRATGPIDVMSCSAEDSEVIKVSR